MRKAAAKIDAALIREGWKTLVKSFAEPVALKIAAGLRDYFSLAICLATHAFRVRPTMVLPAFL